MLQVAMYLGSLLVLSIAMLGVVTGCAHQLALPSPQRVETYCGKLHFRETALKRVVEAVVDGGAESGSGFDFKEQGGVNYVRLRGGAIAYWDDLKLGLPFDGARLPPFDGFVHVRGAAVVDGVPKNRLPGSPYYARLYLLIPRTRSRSWPVVSKGIWRWWNYDTSDREDVCKWLPF